MKRVFEKDGVKEIKSKSRNLVVGKECWSNDSVKIVKKVKCFVPKKIEDIMDVLNRKFLSSEFSIFAISIFDKETNRLVVQEDYYIPKQFVSSAFVNYEEDAPEGFNTVIHKHPRGCRNFSTTDNTYINQNFDYSLLWEGGNFVTGQIRAETMYGLVALEMDIVTNVIYPKIDIKNVENIKIYVPPTMPQVQHDIGCIEHGLMGDNVIKHPRQGLFDNYEDYIDYLRPQQLRSYRGNVPRTTGMLVEKEIPKQKLKGALLNKDLEHMYSSSSENELNNDDIEDYYEAIEELRTQKSNDGVWLTWEDAVDLYDKEHRIVNSEPVKIEC